VTLRRNLTVISKHEFQPESVPISKIFSMKFRKLPDSGQQNRSLPLFPGKITGADHHRLDNTKFNERHDIFNLNSRRQ